MTSLVLEFLGVKPQLSLLSIRAGQSLVDLRHHRSVIVTMHYHPEAVQRQATVDNRLIECSLEALEQIGHDLICNAENLQIPQLIPETIRNTGTALETLDGIDGMGDLPRPGLGVSVATTQSHLRSAFRLAISARKVRLLFRQILPEIWAVGPPRLLAIQTEDAARPLHTDVHQQVEEVVEHNEPPAFRHPELLREQEEHDWADRVVHRILCPAAVRK
ncbi:unnamed protein product [Symbiodinium sp. CCMP2456]|nr:unnamed protein product [Symbiodinium sp. CCMP2456]